MLTTAIDLSDTIIRLAQLTQHHGKWKLHLRAEISVPIDYIDDGELKHPREVSQLLTSLVKAAGGHGRNVLITLPERHTFVKVIALPASESKNLDEVIATSLTQHIPYDADEVYWDWHQSNHINSLGQTQVLLGAAPRTTVDNYLQLYTNAGLRVTAAEIESVVIARAMLGPMPPNDARIIIDLGRTRSTLILVDSGVVQFSSTLRYAGRELNRFIADELHITDTQAERAKKIFGLDPRRGRGLLRTILLPHMDALSAAVTEVEDFYQEHFIDHQPVTTVQLTGSGALLRGIAPELRQRLEQNVVVQPSWIYQQLVASSPDIPLELGYTYTSAFGLAMNTGLAI